MSMTVNLIGAGRVGRTLLRLLAKLPDVAVLHVASRRLASAKEAVSEAGIGEARDLVDMGPADLWFLTVPDTEIKTAAKAIATLTVPPAIAVHCSGFQSASVMEPLARQGWHLASAHPVLSFADPKVSVERFVGSFCGLEGDEAALNAVEPLFKRMGARTFPISSDAKILYHAAAVVTNNFTTVLQAIALEAWVAAGVPSDIARDLNRSLLGSTIENMARLGPAEALTGPAARGDRAVVEEQGQAVAEWHPEAGEIYAILSTLASRLKTMGTTLPDQDPPRR